jgi:hypothetical protein
MKGPQTMTDAPIPTRKRVTPENPAEIITLSGVLSADQRRVRVSVQLSSETTRPDLELVIADAKGEEVCRSTIIENFGDRITFTMHIRSSQTEFPLTLACSLSYEEDIYLAEKKVFVEQEA